MIGSVLKMGTRDSIKVYMRTVVVVSHRFQRENWYHTNEKSKRQPETRDLSFH